MSTMRTVFVATPASATFIDPNQFAMFQVLASEIARFIPQSNGALAIAPKHPSYEEKLARTLRDKFPGRFRYQKVPSAKLM